ncbi:MAG: hypothetical protein JJT96_05655 [Opitutales bacterium]|nr:hypothetical protein [Opitutales bacterium]
MAQNNNHLQNKKQNHTTAQKPAERENLISAKAVGKAANGMIDIFQPFSMRIKILRTLIPQIHNLVEELVGLHSKLLQDRGEFLQRSRRAFFGVD